MLSDLFTKTITLINQIPQSADDAKKVAWKKHILQKCFVANGIFDKSSGNIVHKANAFTVFTQWEKYRPPLFGENNYYETYTTDKELFTAAVGDLVILHAIDDEEPTTPAEFNTIRSKYQDGGLLTSVEAFIHFDSHGNPWKTNHIKLIKG